MKHIIILFLIIAAIALLIFFFANSTLAQRYYALKGKYQWTLLYFPLLYVLINMMLLAMVIVFCIMMNASPLLLNENMIGPFVWSMIALIYLYIAVRFIFTDREDIKDMLLEWEDVYERRTKLLLLRIVIVGTITPLLYFYVLLKIISNRFYNYYSNNSIFQTEEAEILFTNYWIWVAFAVVMAISVIYFGWRRITSFGTDINESVVSLSNFKSRQPSDIVYTSRHLPNTLQPERSSNQSVMENLRELKQLHDDGLISLDEYTQLKTSLLNSGI